MKHPNRLFDKGVLLSGPQNDLDATVLSVVKRPVSIGHFLKVHSINNHERGINLTLFNKFQQLSRIPVNVSLPHSQRQPFTESRAKRYFI
jgi:hypothetical protein